MFLDFLLAQNIITEFQYNKVLAEVNTDFDGDMTRAILSVGVSEDSLTQARASFYKIPYQKVSAKDVTYEVLKRIPEEAARHYKFVPIGFSDGVLSVGVTEPENMESMNALQFISVKLGLPFKVFVISNGDFIAIAENYRALTQEVDRAVGEFNSELEQELSNKQEKKEENSNNKKDDQASIVEDAPIIKIVATIINHAVEEGASDIHIENNGDKVNVRYRIDGVLHTTLVLPIASFSGVVARIKILAKLRLDEKRKPQDGSFATIIENRKVEFRVSTFPAYYGEKVVMRILDSERGIKSLESIEFTAPNLAMIRDAISRPYGLILISGPTGSGKSTTLYSMLNEVDKEGNNVVSLEDPIEYQIPGVTQSQVMPEIGYTFASGLRSILRQDPNIIMVGEIRDKETAQLAIQAALTGHLVLSTIHTNSAIGIVPRLIDMGVDPYLIAPTLILAMAQRLVRKLSPEARVQVPLDEATREMIQKQFSDLDKKYLDNIVIPETMYELKPNMDQALGLKGRVAVFEMFKVDRDIQELILKNPVEPELYKLCRSKGMLTLREDALMKALHGDILLQEVYTFN